MRSEIRALLRNAPAKLRRGPRATSHLPEHLPPHVPSQEELARIVERTELANSLLGKPIRFAHQRKGPDRIAVCVTADGMLELAGMAGQFAPHLFVIAAEAAGV